MESEDTTEIRDSSTTPSGCPGQPWKKARHGGNFLGHVLGSLIVRSSSNGRPDKSVRSHRALPTASENSAVRKIGIMYVSCVSVFGHTPKPLTCGYSSRDIARRANLQAERMRIQVSLGHQPFAHACACGVFAPNALINQAARLVTWPEPQRHPAGLGRLPGPGWRQHVEHRVRRQPERHVSVARRLHPQRHGARHDLFFLIPPPHSS